MRGQAAAKKKPRLRFATLGLALFVALLTVSLVKEYLRSRQIHNEIEALRQQIAELDASNRKTSDFVEYLKTDSYFEQQARLKLGLKAPGERVLVIHDVPTANSGESAIPSGAVALQTFQRDGRTNPRKWFDYFFGGG